MITDDTFTKSELRAQFARDIDSLRNAFTRLRGAFESLGAADAEAARRVCPAEFLSPAVPDLLWVWSAKTWDRLYGSGPKEWGPRKFRRANRTEPPPLDPIPDRIGHAAKRFLLALRAVHIGLRDLDDIWMRLDADERRAASSAYPFAAPAEDILRDTALFHARALAHFSA